MSLLDVLDSAGGSVRQPKIGHSSYADSSFALSGGGSGYTPAGASSSRERGAPERVDINNFVKGTSFGQRSVSDDVAGGAMQGLEIAGKAPGFALERPIAIADTLAQKITGGSSPLENIEHAIGQVPVVGGLLGGAGDTLHNISTLPAAIANQSMADSLKQGTLQGWSDDQLVQTNSNQLADLLHSVLGGRGPDGKEYGLFSKQQMTWGEFKADAAAKGWTSADIKDVIEGRKAETDFGDKRMSSDNLTEMALRFGSDPTNLLFGAGAFLKVGKGVGLLGDAVKAGAELEKPLSITQSIEAVAKGEGLGSTWQGVAGYFGTVGRGIGAIPRGTEAVQGLARAANYGSKLGKAYAKTGLAATGAQVGIGLVDKAVSGDPDEDGNRPHSGFLEPLFQLNRAAFDNQPLSNNVAFSLWSAFHVPLHAFTAPVVGALKTTKTALLGSGDRAAIINHLAEGWAHGSEAQKATQVLNRVGGEEELTNLVMHVQANSAFERLMKVPAIKDAAQHYGGLDEAVHVNSRIRDMVQELVVDDAKKGLNGRKVNEILTAWHGNRLEGSKALNTAEFQWHGGDAIDRWREYSSAAAPVADVFKQRGDVVLGLRDHLIDLDLQHMKLAMRIASPDGKTVSAGTVQSWLSKYPQLIGDDKSWEQYLVKGREELVPIGPVYGKLQRAIKNAPSAAELHHESSAAERQAAKLERNQPITDEDAAGYLNEDLNGSSRVNVSRMRPGIAQRLGLKPSDLNGVQLSRRDAAIQTFEENIGPAMREAGLNVDHVTQALGAWEGSFEPSVEIAMSKARLPELRTAAALTGQIGKQDMTTVSVTGRRLREMNLAPNGHEMVWQLPTIDPKKLGAVAQTIGKVFPGFTLNDTTGIVRVLVKDAEYTPEMKANLERLTSEIEGLYPKDLIGDTGIRTSHHPAYVERLSRKKGEGDATYSDALRDARSAGDPRAGVSTRAAIEKQVAHARGGEANPPAGLGPEPPVGRDASATGRAEDHLSLATPAERVGLGPVETATKQDGYLYHVTDAQAAQSIAGDALRPNGPEYRGEQFEWPSGGSGKRTYFTRDPQRAVPFQTEGHQALLRVREAKAGRVANEFPGADSDAFVSRKIGSQHVEIFGGDGQWHALDGFFDNGVEPDIAAAAKSVATAYPDVASSPGPLAMGLRAQEDTAFASTGNEAAQLAELRSLVDEHGGIQEGNGARAAELNLQIEQSRLAKGEVSRGSVLYNARRDAEVSAEYPLHRSLADLPELQKQDLAALDAQIAAQGGTYQLKAAPKLARFFEENQGSIVADYLKGRTRLGQALADNFVTGRTGRLIDWLTTPVSNSELGRQARQALFTQLLPHGVTTEKVNQFLRVIQDESQKGAVGKGHLKIHVFRPTAQDINAMAAQVFDKKTIESVGADNFAKLVDRAGNRFVRASDQRIAAGTAGRLDRAVNSTYKAWQGSIPGDITRLASKTMYPLMRFYSDPRWWAMNLVEADILMGTKYGLRAIAGAAKAEPGAAALTHSVGAEAAAKAGTDNGWLWIRGHAGYASKAFDAARPESTIEFLRGMEGQAVHADLVRVVQHQDALEGRTARTPGEISDADLAQGMDRLLYTMDQGPKAAKDTITAEAQQILGADEALHLAPFIQKLYERNQGLYDDIVHTLSGNPSRTNLERIGNSWWLYWPLSYQIKATKWLVNIMGEHFGGAQTNLAGAALYAHHYEEHKKRIASDPSYAKMFEDNPTAWFLAQMILPITPGDMGVSLSRPVRYVGGALGDLAESKLPKDAEGHGNRLGLWGGYKNAQDPVTAAGAILSFGPTYTAELLARIGRETLSKPTTNLYPDYSGTSGGTFSPVP